MYFDIKIRNQIILDSIDRDTISLYNSFITSNDTPQLHTAIQI